MTKKSKISDFAQLRRAGVIGALLTAGVSAPVMAGVDADRAAIPRNFDAQIMSSTDVYLTWQDVSSDETNFKIERRDNGGNWLAIGSPPANSTRWRNNQLQPGTSYEYRISAVRPSGVALPTAVRSVRTPAAGATTVFFVDALNGDNINPGTEARPWKTIQKAADSLAPGQTVLVRATAPYLNPNYYALVSITKSGTAAGWITYKNYPGERPILRSTYDKNYHGFEIKSASYIVIDGFEVAGHLADIAPAVAQAENDWAKANPTRYVGPKVDSNGISVSNGGVTPHHITIRNNLVHDHPGGGIAANGSDWVTIENNRIFNTSWYSPYGTTGISYLVSKDVDTNTTNYKQIIRNNTVHDAKNLFPCKCYSFRQQTDGNGIIIDSLTSSAYKGKTLVTNNIIFNNGGRGIHIFKSGNTDVTFNTASRNGTIAITAEGEISVIEASNVRVFDNIMVASADRPLNAVRSATGVNFSYNIGFGGNGFTSTGGTGNRLNTDPKFAPGSGINAFSLQSTSPAVDTAAGGVMPVANDVFLAPRPRGLKADVGAVESF